MRANATEQGKDRLGKCEDRKTHSISAAVEVSNFALCNTMHPIMTLLVRIQVGIPVANCCKECRSHTIQGSAKRRSPGLVNFAKCSCRFCQALPAALLQPGDHLLAEP